MNFSENVNFMQLQSMHTNIGLESGLSMTNAELSLDFRIVCIVLVLFFT